MILYASKPSKPFLIFIGVIIILLASPFILMGGVWAWENTVNRKYQNKDFEAYEQRYRYCAQFFGGTSESQEQIYNNWEKHEGFGC